MKNISEKVWINTVLFIGILFRCKEYLAARSLWLDEAVIAGKLKSFPFLTLVDGSVPSQSLAYSFGFIAVEKILTQLLGMHEYVLRFFPFFCGLLALYIFARIANRLFTMPDSIFALLLFALSPNLIYYSNEAKPYSLDVLVTVVLILQFLKYVEESPKLKNTLQFGLVGAIMVWFSYTSLFMLSAFALCLIYKHRRELRERLKLFGLLFIIWAASFMVYYMLFISTFLSDSALMGYWKVAYMPQDIVSLQTMKWFTGSVFILFQYSMYLPAKLGALFLIIGLMYLIIKRRIVGLMFLFAILSVLGASYFELYPFRGRFILFLYPMILVSLASGVAVFQWDNKLKRIRWVRTLLFAVLLYTPALISLMQMNAKYSLQEIKPVLNYVEKNMKNGDSIYIYYKTQPAYDYYSSRYDFSQGEVILGEGISNDELLKREIHKMSKSKRVWLVITNIAQKRPLNDLALLKKQLKGRANLLDKFIIKINPRVPPFYHKIKTFSAGVYLFERES